MRLNGDVTAAVAELARAYAGAIDEATHVPLGLADALRTLEVAAAVADETGETDVHTTAYRKVAAALSTVTVLGTLGPKLLDAYRTLAPTIGKDAAGAGAGGAGASRLQRLRDRHDGRHLRAVG